MVMTDYDKEQGQVNGMTKMKLDNRDKMKVSRVKLEYN